MKTNIIANNTVINAIMKTYMKYLCAVLLVIGTSAHAWGAINIKYPNSGVGQASYYNGDVITINVDLDDDIVAGANAMTIQNDGTGWTSSTYNRGYIHATISGSYVYSNIAFGMAGVEGNNGTPYWEDDEHYTSFYEWNNWQYETISFYTSYAFDAAGTYNSTITIVQKDDNDASTLQSATITVRYVVTKACATPTVAFTDETIYKDKDASSFTKTATAKVGGSSTGQTITYSSSNTDVATVNLSTGAVTMKGVVGSTVITATATANATYCEASGSYTLYAYTAPTVNNTHMGGTKTPTSATFSGCQVSNKGGLAIQQYGWVIGTTNPVNASNKTTWAGFNADVSTNSDFASATTKADLTPGTTYYVKAFANNGYAIGYSDQVTITTPYLITLDKNGGDADGSAYVSPDGTSLGSITAPTRTGYEVEGYYTTSGVATKVATAAGALQSGITVSATNWTNGSSQWVRGAGETFYAKWSAKTYTVTLDRNGGSGGDGSVTATYGSAMPAATMPSTPPTGKTFDGYYYNSVKYYNSDGSSAHVWDVDGDVTLTASWTTATPTMTIASVDHIVISSTSPSKAEGQSATVAYNTTVTLSHGDPDAGYYWLDWNVYETGNESNVLTVTSNQFTMPAYDVTVSANLYTDLVFSCASLSLTKAGVDTMFITSAASNSVRSQEAFHLTGSGLTPSTEFTFSFGNDDLNSKFAFKLADGTTNVSTDANGAIDADIYVVYTPSGTDDGLDEATILTVSIAGAKPKTTTLNTKTIIGRHLPANFVIAAKKNGKWYALPSNMAASTPSPVEIAVDDSDNPSIAYTATANMYSLYDQSAGEYIKFAMKGQSDAPLFGSTSTAPIGKSGSAIVTSTLGDGYLWKLVQSRATGLTNAKEAKYTIYCKNNSTNHLRLKDDAGNPKWGLYDAGIDELRLITASNATVAEAYFIEYSTNGGVIEVDAGAISATKVLARFNGQTSGKIDLVQTCTSVKNRASAYNYTVTFNGGVNFAAKDAAGKILMLEWYNSSNELVGVTSIEMPRIIASSTTMSGYDTSHGSDNKGYWSGSEVHILPDVTLTGNLGSFSSGGEIKELHIYPGATFKITTGAATRTMHVGTLVLRNGWSRAGSKRYDVARVHIATTANLTHTNAYADWYIDYDQYYPMAVPWDVTVSGISYRYTSLAATVGHDKNIRLRYYDGALRVNGGNGTGTNWRLYGDDDAESVPATLKPSQGYAMTAKRAAGKAFAIVRMPLTFADTWTALGEQGRTGGEVKDTVHVVAHGVGDASKSWYAVGWNFIGNPYMSCFDSNEDEFMSKLIDENGKGVKYATIPDTEFEGFDQVNIASVGNKLKPSSGFFVQVNTTGPLQFKKSQIITPSALARYTNEQEAIPEQEAFILLNGEQGHDQMGLVIGSDYTADYEMNADLSKMLGNANIVKTWMRYTDMDMAYVAINEELAREWIPVTVHIPAEGEYTYSLMNSSTVDELEGLYLIDYETGAITNLIYDEYIFTAEAGTRADRFAINAIVGERKVPTSADITGVDKNGNEPVKFIWHDKVYILHNNVIYDATGKCVNVINK